MITDINIGGVFLPGLLVMALMAFSGTILITPFLSFSRFYRRLPCRPLIDFTTFIIIFALLMQGLDASGLSV
ncbi:MULTISPECIES: DUF1656 domain-containing protein [Rahnella]|jgi:hypothetical protein|uniref:DUF1656 domain-containing protein n=1 Tax=Rahnella sp. (strain Y9602) TaxID=2703885 RepID=A0A0H3F8E7_RAHSY|nr:MULTISPECIES: DUF1656 domain-containing protein [Rahnella]AFE58080.1 hypothetical protein Q7S_09220 [Rahnella aquatilis HX2]AYA06695.1 DUF1656 domain-containing protein [Rahnella aquatilis]ADW73496.1 protein of unknown function DUF1656 [Rahnella aceris]AZP41938.1 DUF1656 domain-containing protein [Rahnella aquatilis]AZP46279.1 DUF1656 domain-containing protein [Rahnella aquatilis]